MRARRSVSKLGMSEAGMLRRKLADAALSKTIRIRYRVIQRWSEGAPASAVARELGISGPRALRWIDRFRKAGFRDFERPTNPAGAPPRIKEGHLLAISRVAAIPPLQLMLPFHRWSVRRLLRYLVAQKLIPEISRERLRQILRQRGISLRRAEVVMVLPLRSVRSAPRRCGPLSMLDPSLIGVDAED